MRDNLRDKFLSVPRYNRYLIATNYDHVRAGKLYNANIMLAQAFHPLLSQLEVVLRNALNSVLSRHFADTDWIINEKAGFMSDRSLGRSNFYLRKCVENVEFRLIRLKIPITSGKIIAEQTFSFWTAFFAPLHYRLISGQSIHVFPNKPSIENRASIYGKLEALREFRNRVNHCEPICFNSFRIDCSYAMEMRSKLLDLIRWIEPGLIPFFAKIDVVADRIDQISKI